MNISPAFRRSLVIVLGVLALPLFGLAQQKKQLTWEQIYRNGEPRLTVQLPAIAGWADDQHYLVSKGREGGLTSVDAATGKEEPFHDLSSFKGEADSTFNLNAPVSHTEDYRAALYVKDGDLYVLLPTARIFKRLTSTDATEKVPLLSPDGKHVGFIRNNDLYSIEIASGKETRYTSDGNDVIYNGYASWVYYEEILGRGSQYRAFWWSPDSKHIAFYRFDDANVPAFPLFNADGQHGSLESQRYPKAGDPNPEVRVGVVTVGSSGIIWADFDSKTDQYFGTPFWTPDARLLFVQWMDRGQDNLKIYGVEPMSGKKKEIYDEHQASWVEWFEHIHFLDGGKGFILLTDKDGWMHAYRYSMDGTLNNRITSGNWAVAGIEAVNEKEQTVFLTARKENSTRTDLYKVKLDGTGLSRLTAGDFTHSVKVSLHGLYFISSYSNVATPTRLGLYDGNGKLVRALGDAKQPAFDDYELAKTELFRVNTPDGYALPVTWTLPVPFDPQKKHPVLISIYGGPNDRTVVDRWVGLGGQWLAKEGVIQVAIDHRGSGHFGKKGVALMYRNLGKWEMNDYVEVVKWLRKKPFVDSTRVCITGESYGGYVTCMALTAGADYFTHGVADFSVTDWMLYDSHYTERYMDSPAENPEGYKNGSVLTYVPKYKGVLRIVHGTMDDNVHMQNSIQLVSALEDLGKHFDFMVYPNGRHGWGGPKWGHLTNETMRFYYEYLIQKPFPEALFSMPRMGVRPF